MEIRNKSFEAYEKAKARYPKHLLFLVEGRDAFSYGADARTLEKKLSLSSHFALTPRGEIECVKIDAALMEHFLARLLRMGISVVVCEPNADNDSVNTAEAGLLIGCVADAFLGLEVFLDDLDTRPAKARARAIQKLIDAAAGEDGGREQRRIRDVLDLVNEERARIRKCKHDYRRLGVDKAGLCCKCGDQSDCTVRTPAKVKV